MPELADRGVDAVIGVDEDAPAPDALEDLPARHELAATLDQQEKQVERDALEMYDAPRMAEFVSAPIQLEVFEFEPFRRHLGPSGLSKRHPSRSKPAGNRETSANLQTLSIVLSQGHGEDARQVLPS